jgi:hypothetical protein
MLVGNRDIIQKDPLHTTLYTKKRLEEYIGKKRCITFTYCNSKGEVTTNKGVIYHHASKYCRCIEYDGKGTCNYEWVHKTKCKIHQCNSVVDLKNQKTLEQLSSTVSKDVNEKDEEIFKECKNLLCGLISSCHLSISSAASPIFWKFIYFCMESFKNSTSENAKDFFPIPNRNYISQSLISRGAEILEEKLAQYAGHIGSLMVDGYSKRQRKIKGFVLCFPQFGGKYEVVRVAEIDNFQDSFSKVGAQVIQYCESMKINISTVNGDGYGFFFFILLNLYFKQFLNVTLFL